MKKFLSLIALLLQLCYAQTARYPGSIVTDSHLRPARNNVVTSLRSSVSASTSEIAVTDASRISADMLLTIDTEIVSVTAVNGNILTVTRGFDGTTAAAHQAGRRVASNVVAWDKNALAAEIKAIQTALGPSLANVPGNAGTLDVTAYDFNALQPGVAITAGNNVLNVTCPNGVSGTNTSHYLYIDQVEADTTATITGAVSAGGLIQITAAAHGFSSGNYIKISGVVGVPANGGWLITVSDANTFTLDGSTFAGTYSSGGTAARGDEPVLITGGTCTSGAAGTLIIDANNPHTSTFSLKSATGGIQEALNMGMAGGVNLRLGSATLYAPVSYDTGAGANYIAVVGRGRWTSIVTVDPGFPIASSGVFVLKAGAVGQTLQNFKVTFTQPDSTDRDSYTRYPPVVYGQNASRTELGGLLIERAWDCFDFRQNAGGSNFIDIWASAFGTGFKLDGSLDTIRVDGLHYWPFSLTANQSTVFENNDNVLGMDIGRVDDLKISNSLFISGKGLNIFTGVVTAGDPVITIQNTSFDSKARIVQKAGEVRFLNSYITMGANANAAGYEHRGGTFTAVGSWFYHVTPNGTYPVMSLVADGSSTFYPTRNAVNVSGSYFLQYGGSGAPDVATLIHANPTTSTDLQLAGNRFQFIENQTYTNPKVLIEGNTNAVITGNFVSGKGSGTGDFLSIATDANHRIAANVASGWTYTLPSTANNGTYEVATRRYGLGVRAPGAGGPGEVLSLYGADATKRKSLRINETTGALEILKSDYTAAVAQINDDGTIRQAGAVLSSLPTADGTIAFCSDCTVTSSSDNTCTTGGTGALAIRLNGAYRCFKDQN